MTVMRLNVASRPDGQARTRPATVKALSARLGNWVTPLRPDAPQRARHPLRFVAHAAAFVDAPDAASTSTHTPQPRESLSAASTIRRLFDALNQREFGSLMAMIADDCQYHDLADHGPANGKLEVAKMYLNIVNHLPRDVALVIEDITEGDSHKVGVTWHVELGGVEIPASKGVSFFVLDLEGRVNYVREAPEHFVKLAPLTLPALGMASTVFQTLGGSAVTMTTVSSALQAVTSTLNPFNALSTLFGASTPLGQSPSDSSPPTLKDLMSIFITFTPSSSAPPAHYSSSLPTAHYPTASTAPLVYTPRSGPETPSYASPQDTDGLYANGHSSTTSTTSRNFEKESREGSYRHTPMSSHSSEHSSSSTLRHGVEFNVVAEAAQAHSEEQHQHHQHQHQHEVVAGVEVVEVLGGSVDGQGWVEPLVMDLSGIWEKDMQVSQLDAYEAALDVWGITGMQRLTARLLDGIEIRDDRKGSRFTLSFLTVVPQFKSLEEYVIGRPRTVRRRDMRSGQATASATYTPRGVRVDQKWGAPYGGALVEDFELLDDGGLKITSNISVGDRTAEVALVYRRRAVDKEQFLRESERKNGSGSDWMKKFMEMM